MKPLLILGSAECLWDDLKKINPGDFDIMGVNHSAIYYPGDIKYWATLHYDYIHEHLPMRKGNKDFEVWSCVPHPLVHKVCENYWKSKKYGTSGSSGLFAVQIGLLLGYDKIVLAGMPVDCTGHFNNKKSIFPPSYRAAWVDHYDEMKGKVTSLSGWSKDFLEGKVRDEGKTVGIVFYANPSTWNDVSMNRHDLLIAVENGISLFTKTPYFFVTATACAKQNALHVLQCTNDFASAFAVKSVLKIKDVACVYIFNFKAQTQEEQTEFNKAIQLLKDNSITPLICVGIDEMEAL